MTRQTQSKRKKTNAIACDDQELVLVIENRFSGIWRSNDKLLHRGISERSGDSQNAVDAVVHDESTSIGDTFSLLSVAAFVVVG